MDTSFIPIESIRERDIDLLLIEEFNSSNKFIDYFFKRCNLPSCDKFIGAWRSITEFGLGETDILIEYISGDKHIGLMIENKLDASFQDRQRERYGERERKYVDSGRFSEMYIVLVAPQKYIESQDEFSVSISYEILEKYYETLGTRRANFKKIVLRIACEKLRRGYMAVNSDIVQSFWLSYWKCATQSFSSLKMKLPKVVPDGSDWIELLAPEGTLRITHKLAQGSLDCIGLTKEQEKNLSHLYPGSEYKDFKSGRVFRIPTAPVNRKLSFESQIENLDVCFRDISVICSL